MVAHAKGGRGSMCSFSALSITLQLYDKRFSTILQVQVHNAFASLSLSLSQLAESVCVWIFFFCWFSFDSSLSVSLFVRETRTKMGKKKSISAQGSNSDGDSGCSGFSSPLLLLLLPLLLLLRLTTTNNSTALGTVTWWLLVATVTHARARMRQRQRSRGVVVVSSSVRWAFFSLRSVLLFYFRYVLSIRLLACFACVRAWEWVSRRGTSHNSLWFSRRTRAVGGEKQPFTLSLFFSFCLSLFLFAADVCYLFFLLL